MHHRYNNFAALHQALCVGGVALPLPPKKVFGNTERQFLQERQTGLQNLLDEILKMPLLSSSLETRKFLDPRGYSENFYGWLEKIFTPSVYVIFSPREWTEECVDVFSIGAELAGGGAIAQHWVEMSQAVLPHHEQDRQQGRETYSDLG